MTKDPAGLAIVQVSGLGAAYALVNSVDAFPGTIPLEVIPTAQGACCLLEGPGETLRMVVREQRSADLAAVTVLDSCSRRVLEAFYALETAPLNGALIVIEHEFLGKVIELADQAERQRFGLVEIKAARGGQAKAVLLLTLPAGITSLSDEQENWLRRVKNLPGCQLERIDKVGPALTGFFEGIE